MIQGYQATTAGITVTVRVFYLADKSNPDAAQFVWAYRVNIANGGRRTVKLLARTWHITDAHGHIQTVHGDGVVGEQPTLEPGESFEYTSGTPLQTPTGFMTGRYHMIDTAAGEEFDIAIPSFSLDSPHHPRQLH